jgi:hypothetical protein
MLLITKAVTIAKLGNQPSCPSMDDSMKKMLHRYTAEFYSITKKNKIILLARK